MDKVGSDGLRVYPNEDELEGCLANIPVINLSTVQDNCLSGDSTPWHGKPTVIRCQAPKGTLIFADTFGIHRGGHVESGHRDMVMTTYSTNFNVHKPHFAVTQDYAKTLNPFMKMSFGIS